jgi:hypothetical protein
VEALEFGGADAGWREVAGLGSGCEAGAASFALVLVLDFILGSGLVAGVVPPLAVTRGVIFLIVALETPAFDNPSTEE